MFPLTPLKSHVETYYFCLQKKSPLVRLKKLLLTWNSLTLVIRYGLKQTFPSCLDHKTSHYICWESERHFYNIVWNISQWERRNYPWTTVQCTPPQYSEARLISLNQSQFCSQINDISITQTKSACFSSELIFVLYFSVEHSMCWPVVVIKSSNMYDAICCYIDFVFFDNSRTLLSAFLAPEKFSILCDP